MQLMIVLLNTFFGACLGSHASVVAQRFGVDDFIWSRSRCSSCLTTLNLLDEIPLWSFLRLRGKCRYCQTKINPNLFYAELLGALSCCQLSLWQISDLKLAAYLYACLILALQDLDTQTIDLWLFLPPAVLAAFWPAFPHPWWNWVSFLPALPLLGVLSYLIWRRKMGSADLLFFCICLLYWGTFGAIKILLLACLCGLSCFLLQCKTNKAIAFLPCCFVGQLTYLFLA